MRRTAFLPFLPAGQWLRKNLCISNLPGASEFLQNFILCGEKSIGNAENPARVRTFARRNQSAAGDPQSAAGFAFEFLVAKGLPAHERPGAKPIED